MSIRRQSFPANNSDATNAPEVDRSDWPRDVDTPTRTPTTCSLQLISSQKLILVVYVCVRARFQASCSVAKIVGRELIERDEFVASKLAVLRERRGV